MVRGGQPAFIFNLDKTEGDTVILVMTKKNPDVTADISNLRFHACFEPKRKYATLNTKWAASWEIQQCGF